jgi:hypothetical protein
MITQNFLISYSGRVGSTALIDTLKLLPTITVPVFEELDYWALEASGGLEQHNAANIHTYVDSIYAERAELRATSGLSTGFKWRIWGDIPPLAEVLKRHDVMLLNLMRADIVEFIASLYFTNIVYGEFNAPQFALRDAQTEEERLSILFRYRMQPVDVDVDRYFQLFDERLAEEQARHAVLQELAAHGVQARTILYEDFSYKRFHFLAGLTGALGLPAPVTTPVTKLAKVSPPFPSELFRNRAALLDSPRLPAALQAWEALVYSAAFPPLD